MCDIATSQYQCQLYFINLFDILVRPVGMIFRHRERRVPNFAAG